MSDHRVLQNQDLIKGGQYARNRGQYSPEYPLTPESTLEDVYDQLSLLADIEESEHQVQNGETLTQQEVEEKAKEWLR